MCASDLAFHYVCTPDQAWDLISQHDHYWISNCGCREEHGPCKRSRIDVCLDFRGDTPVFGSGKRPATRQKVEVIFQEAREKWLVARPFRDEHDKSRTEGICFCCDDCCDYFVNPTAALCDKGSLLELTHKELCIDCGNCVEVCYFKARQMANGEMVIHHELCYGCGLCALMCPEKCIEMV